MAQSAVKPLLMAPAASVKVNDKQQSRNLRTSVQLRGAGLPQMDWFTYPPVSTSFLCIFAYGYFFTYFQHKTFEVTPPQAAAAATGGQARSPAEENIIKILDKAAEK